MVALVTLASLLMAGGASAFCMPASHDLMKCCKPARPCATGMKAADCCRFVPTSTGQSPAVVETYLPSKASREEMREAAPAGILGDELSSGAVSPQTSPPPHVTRDPSVPLYILNTSLLR
jgi:hypothetical protein